MRLHRRMLIVVVASIAILYLTIGLHMFWHPIESEIDSDPHSQIHRLLKIGDSSKLVAVAGVDCVNDDLNFRVEWALAADGIPCGFVGSCLYDVLVPSNRRSRALQILRELSKSEPRLEMLEKDSTD